MNPALRNLADLLVDLALDDYEAEQTDDPPEPDFIVRPGDQVTHSEPDSFGGDHEE